MYNKIEIIKFFLEKKIFPLNPKVYDVLLFEYTILHSKFEIAELLIQQPSIIPIGQCSLELIKLPSSHYLSIHHQKLSKFYHPIMSAKNLISFFIKTADNNEYLENIKCQIVLNKAGFFACLVAQYSNEKEFVDFYDKFNLDINLIDKSTILFG
ncbi:hypothetical protein M9Y10_035995 [Tritrichomonas musculus]|uniref:Uncharacterized protein n=1 Tax=Tritrichomonas musculus TaxID=1915356 RepID=A0ABR2GVU3_9EUKA